MKKFNIRVYGILVNPKNEVLVSDEKRNGFEFTKFPGGGLDWGEGTIECLKREFIEELNLKIEIDSLFYLTDYFQISDFGEDDQLISIYYKISCENWKEINTTLHQIHQEKIEHHRWISISELTTFDLNFPIDKFIVSKLKESIDF